MYCTEEAVRDVQVPRCPSGASLLLWPDACMNHDAGISSTVSGFPKGFEAKVLACHKLQVFAGCLDLCSLPTA